MSVDPGILFSSDMLVNLKALKWRKVRSGNGSEEGEIGAEMMQIFLAMTQKQS